MAVVAGRAAYLQLGARARQKTVEGLIPIVGRFALGGWNAQTFSALWANSFFGDWRRIDRGCTDIDRLDVAVWVDIRLVGMGLITVAHDAIVLDFVEGDPDPVCPLRGSVTLILLDVATNYAQLLGKLRLHVQPMNSALTAHYESFGFREYPRNVGSPFMWKEV